MTAPDRALLQQIVFECASELQRGLSEDPDKWQDLADELNRAYKLAQIEATQLAESAYLPPQVPNEDRQ